MTISTQLAQSLADERAQLEETLKRFDSNQGPSGATYLTLAEQHSYDTTVRRMADIDNMLNRAQRFDAVAAVNRSIGIAGTGPATVGTSGGEQLLTLGRASLGQLGVEKYRSAIDDAETLQRVLAHGVAADGTAPVTIEGDLIKFVDANRYAVNAARRVPMPDNHAPTFKRPRVTQRTTVGTQAAEGDVLSSQRLQLTGDTVTKVTKGGVLSLSEQEIDWTDPAMLGLAVQDLAESYAIDTDDFLCTAIETAFTASVQTVLSLTAASDVFIKALADASAVVYANSKKLPDTLFLSVDRWAYVQSLVDGEGRPLFSNIGAVNAGGQVPAGQFGGQVQGLNVVVDPNFTAGVWGVAASQLVEFYEQDKGLLSVQAPSTLEVIYAYRGYVAANVYTQGVNAFETS